MREYMVHLDLLLFCHFVTLLCRVFLSWQIRYRIR